MRHPTTLLYGILGYPLGHTLSPAMQNAAFAAAGIDAVYLPVSIRPDRIRASLAGLKASGFSGFNVTVPYKETVIPFLDRLTPHARAVRAVNTIVVHPSGRWIGHNTDVFGFEMLLARNRISVLGKRVLVLGAGGAAKAVCAAVLPAALSVDIANRTAVRARRLRASFPKRLQKKIRIRAIPLTPALSPLKGERGDCVVINTTPVGLRSRDRLPLPACLFEDAESAIDLIYNPPVTDFLRRARKAGCRSANGLDMLLYQGARAFELWTGRPAPVRAMRRALQAEPA